MGVLSHLVADVEFPLNASDADPREPLYRDAYRQYIERVLGRIPFVVDREPPPALEKDDIQEFVRSIARRARQELRGSSDRPSRTTARRSRPPPSTSAPSLSGSPRCRTRTPPATSPGIWRHLWVSINGDMQGTPFLGAPPPEKVQFRPVPPKPKASGPRRRPPRPRRHRPRHRAEGRRESQTGRKRALVSVYDKTGVADLGRELAALGYTILSTGGTAAALKSAGVPVVEIAHYTGQPEILEGRVKTLHPKIHGGILADLSKESHRAT